MPSGILPPFYTNGGGDGGGSPPTQLPGLGRYLRRRYTSNLAITEQLSANDLLHDVIFVASRQYFTQAANGKLSLNNKKPVPYGFTTAAIAAAAASIPLDAVTDWIGHVNNLLLISPNTNKSEIKTVTAAAYTTAQNSITFSSTGGLFTIVAFAGCDGANTPATGSIRVTAATASTACTVTLENTTFAFTTSSSGETVASIASFIAGVIASHPALFRRFNVVFDNVDKVTLTPKFGTLTLDTGLAYAKNAPLADPVTAPTLSAAGTDTTFLAGEYAVGYCATNAAGDTLLSKYKKITITATQHIAVATISLPAGATALKWFCSTAANSLKLRYIVTSDGTGFNITSLPKLTAALTPDLNRTGAEVMRVAAVFSDRALTRSEATKSNILQASYSWLLGTRTDSINRIDLKYRDASQDWRLIDLRIRDDAHIAKVKKILNKEYNGQAIDNTDQAYRICAGLLAEKRDADFFYQWDSTREALLLQEGDVVAITDGGSGVINLPVMLEQITFDISNASLPKATFIARKYASNLYDDSIVELAIPMPIEPAPGTTEIIYLTNEVDDPLTNEAGEFLTTE